MDDVHGPWTHHNGSVELFTDSEVRTRLVWTTDMLPHDAVHDTEAMIDQACGLMKDTLERNYAARESPLRLATRSAPLWRRSGPGTLAGLVGSPLTWTVHKIGLWVTTQIPVCLGGLSIARSKPGHVSTGVTTSSCRPSSGSRRNAQMTVVATLDITDLTPAEC
jgi:hypothetical protein